MKKTAKLMIAMLLVVLLGVTLVACVNGGTSDTKYTISFECNGGSAVADMIVDGKSEITTPKTTKERYSFAGWYVDNGIFNEKFGLAYITANPTKTAIKVYAKWTINKYTVTFDSNGGSAVAPITQDYNTLVAKPTDPTKAENIFGGWYKDSNFATTFNFATEVLTENTTIYVKWITIASADLLDFTYTDSTNTAYSIKKKASATLPTEIALPSSYNGAPVTSIASDAFSGCSGLTLIVIPNSVTSIGAGAFSGCSGLTSITIPNSVTSIGAGAFSDCSGLTSIMVDEGNTKYYSAGNCIIETATNTLIAGCKNSTIPTDGRVTSIGAGAFSGCSGLTSITIPNSVTSIGTGAFEGTAWLKNQPDGLVYAGKFAYCYKGKMPENTALALKNDTIGIAGKAFYTYSTLTSITIPNSVASIGADAFRMCSGLTSITIPDNVLSIGNGTFYKCSGLTSVTIGSKVASIGEDAFRDCSGLTLITIPGSVISIDNNAFFGCSGLTSVTIPNSVASIGNFAFYGCSELTSITIPNSVASLGFRVFYTCNKLTSIKCRAESQPKGWDTDWKVGCNATPTFGYKGV